jgi:energy-coupling factor transporter ATP-binding protein EcfA2
MHLVISRFIQELKNLDANIYPFRDNCIEQANSWLNFGLQKKIAFVGPAGVGKSKLINQLIGTPILPSGNALISKTKVMIEVTSIPQLQNPRAVILFKTSSQIQRLFENYQLSSEEERGSPKGVLARTIRSLLFDANNNPRFDQQGNPLHAYIDRPPLCINLDNNPALILAPYCCNSVDNLHYLVDKIVIEGNFQHLPPGITLVDLPGTTDAGSIENFNFQSNNNNSFYNFVCSCDHVFFLLNATDSRYIDPISLTFFTNLFVRLSNLNRLTFCVSHFETFDQIKYPQLLQPEEHHEFPLLERETSAEYLERVYKRIIGEALTRQLRHNPQVGEEALNMVNEIRIVTSLRFNGNNNNLETVQRILARMNVYIQRISQQVRNMLRIIKENQLPEKFFPVNWVDQITPVKNKIESFFSAIFNTTEKKKKFYNSLMQNYWTSNDWQFNIHYHTWRAIRRKNGETYANCLRNRSGYISINDDIAQVWSLMCTSTMSKLIQGLDQLLNYLQLNFISTTGLDWIHSIRLFFRFHQTQLNQEICLNSSEKISEIFLNHLPKFYIDCSSPPNLQEISIILDNFLIYVRSKIEAFFSVILQTPKRMKELRVLPNEIHNALEIHQWDYPQSDLNNNIWWNGFVLPEYQH